MGKPGKIENETDYVRRELDGPVKKVVHDKLNDPFIATKKGEQEAEQELKKGVERSARQKNKKRSSPAG
jgi:hypothetical protein